MIDTMTMDNSRPDSEQAPESPSPLETVSNNINSDDLDQVFWWDTTAPSLFRLLLDCKYSQEQQLAHLRWYQRWIIPALGPRFHHGKEPRFKSILVRDGSICEFSLNWKQFSKKQTVRFTIEATGFDAGTEKDPFNQEATKTLLRGMADEIQNIDLSLFEHIVKLLFLPNNTFKELSSLIPPNAPLTRAWVAFDLEGGDVMAKAYFIPALMSVRQGISPKDLAFSTIKSWPGSRGAYDACIEVLDDFLTSFPSGKEFLLFPVYKDNSPAVTMVAIDCVTSDDARIKVYIESTARCLRAAKAVYTLDGRLKGDVIDAGLQALSELWGALFGLNAAKDEDREFYDDLEVLHQLPHCVYGYEMRRGSAAPSPKIYIPVVNSQQTDAQLSEALSGWFSKSGDHELARSYKSRLANTL